jgi:hypothetical protein
MASEGISGLVALESAKDERWATEYSGSKLTGHVGQLVDEDVKLCSYSILTV